MNTIHLATEDGRNARVPLLRPQRQSARTIRVTALREAVATKTVHRGDAPLMVEDLDPLSLIDGDPEIDLRNLGRILPETQRGYRFPGSSTLEGAFQVIVTTFAPDGSVRDRSRYTPRVANINDVTPIRVGKRMPLEELFRRFSFHNQLYLGHEDGLQHDFLLALARDLERRGEAATLGAGPKGNLPLILQSGGTPTRAFLMGDTQGEAYRLRVLFTRQELRIPESQAHTAPA